MTEENKSYIKKMPSELYVYADKDGGFICFDKFDPYFPFSELYVRAAAPEPEKAQGDDVMTDKELRDWIFQWSQNEGKIPLESDINDLIWTIQKYAPPAVSPADAGVESAGELAEKIYEWCACLTRDDAENQIRGLLGRLSSRASLSAGQGVAWQPIETAPSDTVVLLYSPDRGISNEERIECREFRNTKGGTQHSWATHWMPLPASPATKSKPSEGE